MFEISRGFVLSVFKNQFLSSIEPPVYLLVFLHGYNNTREEMSPLYSYLQSKLPNLAIAAPEGQNESHKEPERKSWYKISGFDHENKRRLQETPVEEIAQIYNQAAPALAETAENMNLYIDDIQKRYGFCDQNTYIAGFSQGAMLAIWTALIRKQKLAGCFSFSGLAAGNDYLDDKIVSRPNIYLLHGKDDNQVLFKCMAYTADWLAKENVPVQTAAFEKLGHHILHVELDYIANIIKSC